MCKHERTRVSKTFQNHYIKECIDCGYKFKETRIKQLENTKKPSVMDKIKRFFSN